MTPFRIAIVGFFLLAGTVEPDKFGMAIGAGAVVVLLDWAITGNRGQGYAMWVPTLLLVLVGGGLLVALLITGTVEGRL